MSQIDCLQRFLFDEAPVRGAVVFLEETWRQVLSRRRYPKPVRKVLGEMMAAAALLGANLKFDGTLILQMHGTGALRLAVVECTHERTLRATAKWEGMLQEAPLAELLGSGGRFVMTLEPKVDKSQTWQGIVALEGVSVGAMLENYMQRSEQLETRLILATSSEHAAGILLQRLPDSHGDTDGWLRARALADTVEAEELLTLAPRDTLYRLYHEEAVRVFEPEPCTFSCACSRERVAQMLKMVGAREAASILQEQGSVEIGCDFCNQRYVFDEEEVNALFQMRVIDAARQTRH